MCVLFQSSLIPALSSTVNSTLWHCVKNALLRRLRRACSFAVPPTYGIVAVKCETEGDGALPKVNVIGKLTSPTTFEKHQLNGKETHWDSCGITQSSSLERVRRRKAPDPESPSWVAKWGTNISTRWRRAASGTQWDASSLSPCTTNCRPSCQNETREWEALSEGKVLKDCTKLHYLNCTKISR